MGQRYLVTGAAGFLGYFVASALSRREGATVVCIDNFVRGEADRDFQELTARSNVIRLDCDLADRQKVAALPDVDLVFHMAALNGTQNFYERPFDVVRHCTLPTLHLLERYAEAKLARFVYAGTSEAYASTVTRFGWEVPTAEDVPLSVDDPANVRWSYGASKMHGEIAAFAAARQYGLAHSVIRYHNVYGPRMGDKHVVPDFLMRAARGDYVLYGAEDTRAFIYVDDAVQATLEIAENPDCVGEIVNIGGAREIRIDELGRLMMDAGGWTGEITVHPSPKGSVRRRAPDLGKLRRLTGFEERWALERGLEETARFYVHEAGLTGYRR